MFYDVEILTYYNFEKFRNENIDLLIVKIFENSSNRKNFCHRKNS